MVTNAMPPPPFKSVLPLAPPFPSLRQQWLEGLEQHLRRLALGIAPDFKPQPKLVPKHPPPRRWMFTTVLHPPLPPINEQSDTDESDTESLELDDFFKQITAMIQAPRVELDAELTRPHVVFAIDFDAELRALHNTACTRADTTNHHN